MLTMILLILCAVIYYRAAEMENAPGWLWALLSVSVYLLTWLVLGWGLLGCFFGQVALYFAITIYKMAKHSRKLKQIHH